MGLARLSSRLTEKPRSLRKSLPTRKNVSGSKNVQKTATYGLKMHCEFIVHC